MLPQLWFTIYNKGNKMEKVFLFSSTQWEEETLRERAEVIKENDMVKERLTMNIFICSWTLLLKYF